MARVFFLDGGRGVKIGAERWSERTCVSIAIHVHVARDGLAKHLQTRADGAPRQFLQHTIPAFREKSTSAKLPEENKTAKGAQKYWYVYIKLLRLLKNC